MVRAYRNNQAPAIAGPEQKARSANIYQSTILRSYQKISARRKWLATVTHSASSQSCLTLTEQQYHGCAGRDHQSSIRPGIKRYLGDVTQRFKKLRLLYSEPF
jgi:hypothetical protein